MPLSRRSRAHKRSTTHTKKRVLTSKSKRTSTNKRRSSRRNTRRYGGNLGVAGTTNQTDIKEQPKKQDTSEHEYCGAGAINKAKMNDKSNENESDVNAWNVELNPYVNYDEPNKITEKFNSPYVINYEPNKTTDKINIKDPLISENTKLKKELDKTEKALTKCNIAFEQCQAQSMITLPEEQFKELSPEKLKFILTYVKPEELSPEKLKIILTSVKPEELSHNQISRIINTVSVNELSKEQLQTIINNHPTERLNLTQDQYDAIHTKLDPNDGLEEPQPEKPSTEVLVHQNKQQKHHKGHHILTKPQTNSP